MMTQNTQFNVLQTWMVAKTTGAGQVHSASNHLEGYWERSMKMGCGESQFYLL